jgi:hypothetical protein
MITARPRCSNNIPRLIVNLASIIKFKHLLLKIQIDGGVFVRAQPMLRQQQKKQ